MGIPKSAEELENSPIGTAVVYNNNMILVKVSNYEIAQYILNINCHSYDLDSFGGMYHSLNKEVDISKLNDHDLKLFYKIYSDYYLTVPKDPTNLCKICGR